MPHTTRRDFIKTTAAVSLGSLAAMNAAMGQAPAEKESQATPPPSKAKTQKSKRDRMTDVLDMSATPSYVPAAFFMHFGVKGDAAVKAHLGYFHGTGMDFVKIQFDEQELKLPPGVEVKTPQDWAKIPILTEKWFEPSLYLLKRLVAEAKSEALIIQTMYSPFQMAKQAVPSEVLVEHVKQDAEAVCRGMENIALSILHFARAAVRVGADGFYACAQGGETNRVADLALFNRAIKAYDMLLYKELSQLASYNIMHLCDYEGTYDKFEERFHDYPGNVVNVPLSADAKPLSLKAAADMFHRPIMGGIDRHGALTTGTAEDAKKAAIEALKAAPPNFILGADCTVDPKTPIENLRAAIEMAHGFRGV